MALHITMTIPGDPDAIEDALEGLVRLNLGIMRQRHYPPLYSTDIRYRLEPIGRDDWQTADRLISSGEGDCEDVMAYRVAELRLAGELGARARVVPVPGREDAFHTFVQRQDGTAEDPSKILIIKEQTMANDKPTICVRDVGGHCLGVVEVPLRDGRKATAQTLGFDAWGAITGALHEIVNSPGLMALISPQAAAAITVAKRIADMSPDELKKLTSDPNATDSQKKLAKEVLKSPAKGGKGGSTPAAQATDAAPVSDWTILPKSQNIGAAAAPYFGQGTIVRTHGAGGDATTTHQQAPMTAAWGSPNVIANPATAGQGASSSAAPAPAPATHGTRVTDAGPATASPGVQEAPLDPTSGAYIAPDGSPYVWIPGTDANHPGHWMRSSALPQTPAPAPGMMPPTYPPGMMPPTYPPVLPGGFLPPPWGVDPSAMQYGYPWPYGAPYGYGGSPVAPFAPPGWWGGLPMGQSPEPLSLDDAAAVTLWGAQSFAPGAYPGYI